MSDFGLILKAVAFAARAHRYQLRKDRETPYASHAFRVCLTARHLFGIDDPRALAAAVLHDTIEDTNTDYDDVLEHFGKDIADWVGLLSKDKRQEEDARESEYMARLAAAPWQVQVCKLADVHDNLTDSEHLPTRSRSVRRARAYLDALKSSLRPEAQGAFGIVDELLETLEKSITNRER